MFSVFNTATRSAASLLILTATIVMTACAALPARDFDPGHCGFDHSVDGARAWYDHDFDTLLSEFDGGGNLEDTCAKAWYDRDFDIPDDSAGNRSGTSATRDFDGAAPG